MQNANGRTHGDSIKAATAFGSVDLDPEAILDYLINETDDGFFAVDRGGRFIFVNEHIARSSGYPKEWFEGRHYLDLIVPEDHSLADERFETAMSGEKVETHELAYLAASGERLKVELKAVPFRRGDRVVAILGFTENLTKRRAIEISLRQSEERYRSLVETLPCGVAVVEDGAMVFTNPALDRMFQTDLKSLPPDESILRFITPPDRRRMLEMFQRRVTGQEKLARSYSVRVRRNDGSEFPIEVVAQPMMYGEKGAVQYVCTDLSEKHRMEAQIRQSQKMEAIGKLAGGIAHDFNNLLTSVLGLASLLKAELEPREGGRDTAELIEQAAQEAALLTRQLLEFARQGKVEKRPVPVDLVVQNVFTILGRTMEKRIQLVIKAGSPGALVLGDSSQLQQVFMNLAVNAVDAMPEGGTIEVCTRSIDRVEPGFMVGMDESPDPVSNPDPDPDTDTQAGAMGSFVEISVSDTGTGIPDEIQSRIFDPFFSTKPTGRGTGMGLAVVYGIVKSHKGLIEVVPNEPKGTVFKVILPVMREAAATAGDTTVALPKIEKEATILVVDDEQIVLRSTKKMLSEFNYDVLLANCGSEGVEIYRSNHDRIDLVILDYTMAGMDGMECFEQLREIDPKITALLATGYGDEELADRVAREGMAGILAKPFSLSTLADNVARALHHVNRTRKV